MSTQIEQLQTENAKLRAQIKTMEGEHARQSQLTVNFARSKLVAEKFSVPADILQSRFGNHFTLEDGKLVARDNAGNRIFSRTRPGELAEFDEALETLVGQYADKDRILKSPDGNPVGSRQAEGGAAALKRSQFDALSPQDRFSHIEGGGIVIDDNARGTAKQNAAGAVIQRAEFDGKSPRERAAFFKTGGRLVD